VNSVNYISLQSST